MNGPASCMALPVTETQLKNELVEMYRNCRNRFWLMKTGEMVSRRTVNCRPPLKVIEFVSKVENRSDSAVENRVVGVALLNHADTRKQ